MGKRTVEALLISVFFLIIASYSQSFSQNKDRIVIGTIRDGDTEKSSKLLELIKLEVNDLLEREYDIVWPEQYSLVSGWNSATVRTALDSLLNASGVDIIITPGVLSSSEAGLRRTDGYVKPVIAPLAVGAKLLGYPRKGIGSGRHNFNYITFVQDINSSIERFREVVDFDTLTIVVSLPFIEVFPQFHQLKELFVSDHWVVDKMILPGSNAAEALGQLDGSEEAIFLAPQFQMNDREFQALIDGFNARKLPVFSMFGRDEVEKGALCSNRPALDFQRLARRVALNVQRTLMGEDPKDIPVEFDSEESLTINMNTARMIGVKPSWAVLTEAELIGEQEADQGELLTLKQAVDEALRVNLALRSRELELESSRENISSARSNLLPQLDISTGYLRIDEDRAAASFGSQPEKTFNGSADFSQLLFSEAAWANYAIRRDIYRGQVMDRESFRLDIVQQAATAYLNVLRAGTLRRIQQNNLNLTLTNLNLARIRVEIGEASPAELYRWQSQRANARKSVIQADWGLKKAKTQLNRLLHRPLEQPFKVEDVPYDYPMLVTSDPRLDKYVDNPWDYNKFRNLVVESSLAESPELKQLDYAIAAQERLLRSKKSAFFVPNIGLKASISRRFREGGAGTEGLQLPASIPIEFPQSDRTNWNVGIAASIPLFNGGRRIAETEPGGKRPGTF